MIAPRGDGRRTGGARSAGAERGAAWHREGSRSRSTASRGEAWVPPPGAVNLIGYRPIALELGRAVVELLPDERRVTGRDGRSVFGAYLAAIADAAMGLAYNTTLEAGQTGPTLELEINFLRPARPGVALRAEGRVLKSGGATGYATCAITDAAGQLVAHATCTCMRVVARPDPAA
jgi:uncharacterized protein (TIGR00369 family)